MKLISTYIRRITLRRLKFLLLCSTVSSVKCKVKINDPCTLYASSHFRNTKMRKTEQVVTEMEERRRQI